MFWLLTVAFANPPTTVVASWYGDALAGRLTASGQVFDPSRLTAAHPSHPFGTVLRVRRGEASVEVLVNDRGPFVKGRGLDLSAAAAEQLGLRDVGVGPVEVEVVSLGTPRKRWPFLSPPGESD